jgi:uncharacterized protein
MELKQEIIDHRYHIDSYSAQDITLLDGESAEKQRYTCPLIISPTALITTWEITSPTALTCQSLEPLLALNPKILLLGTGATLIFPSKEILSLCHQAKIGIEAMTTPAACRTFNLLAQENREVVAGLFV